jgi:hypothetical protein
MVRNTKSEGQIKGSYSNRKLKALVQWLAGDV